MFDGVVVCEAVDDEGVERLEVSFGSRLSHCEFLEEGCGGCWGCSNEESNRSL